MNSTPDGIIRSRIELGKEKVNRFGPCTDLFSVTCTNFMGKFSRDTFGDTAGCGS